MRLVHFGSINSHCLTRNVHYCVKKPEWVFRRKLSWKYVHKYVDKLQNICRRAVMGIPGMTRVLQPTHKCEPVTVHYDENSIFRASHY